MNKIDQQDELPQLHLLTETDLAVRWKVSKRTIQRWRQNGILPGAFRIGRKILFKTENIVAFEALPPVDRGGA